ncbi:MAG: hypothetical protein ACXVZ4_02450 [Gaiellaceae bacterium]
MPPKGPLAARFRAWSLDPPRAGALGRAFVELENAGTVAWRSQGGAEGVLVSYHWLDARANPIVWDGIRTPLPRAVEPGESLRAELAVR